MPWGKMPHTAWMFDPPGLYLFALLHPYMIEADMHRRDGRGHLPVSMRQKRAAFHLPLACSRRSVDRARARVKPGKEVQGARARFLSTAPRYQRRESAVSTCGHGGRAVPHGEQGRQRLAVGQQENGTRPFRKGQGCLLCPEPSLQGGTWGVIKGKGERGVTSLHGPLPAGGVHVCGSISHPLASFAIPVQWGLVLRRLSSTRRAAGGGRREKGFCSSYPFV
jgi:hypothetical protein